MTSSVDVGETTWSSEGHVTVSERRYWTLVLVVIPALTLFGNALVVLSVWREMSLRTATNYFIVSLAVADVMVAVLVMPFAVYVEVFSVPHHYCQCLYSLSVSHRPSPWAALSVAPRPSVRPSVMCLRFFEIGKP